MGRMKVVLRFVAGLTKLDWGENVRDYIFKPHLDLTISIGESTDMKIIISYLNNFLKDFVEIDERSDVYNKLDIWGAKW